MFVGSIEITAGQALDRLGECGHRGVGESTRLGILLALFELFIDTLFRLVDVLDEPPGGKQGAAKEGESEEKNQDFKPHLSELTRLASSEQPAAFEIEDIDPARFLDHFDGELEETDLPGVIDTGDDGGERVA